MQSSVLLKYPALGRILEAIAVFGLLGAAHVVRAAAEPIPIAVTANQSSPIGRAISQGARLAVDEINASGGIDGRRIRIDQSDNHASSTEAIRGFQRAVQQNADVAVIGTYISEVALALEPWAARLKQPLIITGAASNKITQTISEDPERYKYVFQNTFNSIFWARSVCSYAHDILVEQLGYRRATLVSEDAAWTLPLDQEYQKCLPKAGLKITGQIRFSPDTLDFTPIFSKARRQDAGVMIVGLAHTGVKPTIQWHQQQVPMMMAGMSVQAQAGGFWKATNGATNGVITVDLGASKSARTPKTKHFATAYVERFGEKPAFDAYTSYDAVYELKNAIQRAGGSTDGDAIAKAFAQTDYEGTIGRIAFYGPDAQHPHTIRFGPGYVTGVADQWQDGQAKVIWPRAAAAAEVQVPEFVKTPKNNH